MNQELRRKLRRITDILWAGGVTNPVTYIEQISYLIYLKLLDEEESNRELKARLLGAKANGNGELLFPGDAEHYRWSKWRFKSGTDLRDFVRDQVFPYMASLVKEEPQIAEYFRDAVLEITDPNVLKQVVDEIDGIDFAKLGTDVKGDIFEYLLTHLGQSALNGQFRTPRQIRTMMVEMVDPDLGDTIYDPACGTGGFLIDAVQYILAKYSSEPTEDPIYGAEWLENKARAMGLIAENEDIDIIDLPRRQEILRKIKEQIPTLQTYRKGPGEKIPDWGLLEHSIYGIDVSRQMMRIAMMNLVLHGIRHAMVKRANTLSEMGGLSEEDLNRRYKAILSNPPFAGVLPKESIRKDLPTNSKTGVFKPYEGVKTGVLVFRRPVSMADHKSSVKNAKVWFYEVRADGFDPDKIQGGGRPETPERNDIPDLLAKWKEYKASDFTNPPGVEAGTLLEPGTDLPAPRPGRFVVYVLKCEDGSLYLGQTDNLPRRLEEHRRKKVSWTASRLPVEPIHWETFNSREEAVEREKKLKTGFGRKWIKREFTAGRLAASRQAGEPRSWWATIETIADNDYNLAAGRYKPQIAEKAPDEDPAQLIRETLALEKEITAGLEKLLREIEL